MEQSVFLSPGYSRGMGCSQSTVSLPGGPGLEGAGGYRHQSVLGFEVGLSCLSVFGGVLAGRVRASRTSFGRVEEDLPVSIGVLIPLSLSVWRRILWHWLVSALAYMGDAWQSCYVVRMRECCGSCGVQGGRQWESASVGVQGDASSSCLCCGC